MNKLFYALREFFAPKRSTLRELRCYDNEGRLRVEALNGQFRMWDEEGNLVSEWGGVQ